MSIYIEPVNRFSLAKESRAIFAELANMMLDTGFTLPEGCGIFAKILIEAALEKNYGNKCAAARDLGIHRNTLDRHIDLLKINHRKFTRYALKKPPVNESLLSQPGKAVGQ